MEGWRDGKERRITHLQLVLKKVLLVRHLAVHAQEPLLIWAQRLNVFGLMLIQVVRGEDHEKDRTYAGVDFILLVRIHCE